MAPTRSKKGKSTESQSSVDIAAFPISSTQTALAKSSTPNRTPTSRSPIRKAPRGITVNQKQAMIDNLQLEITERARKLRAQYMLQAQGLRSRVEIRVNRIPTALRKVTMGELFLKYNENVAKQSTLPFAQSTTTKTQFGSPLKNLLQETQQKTARNSPSPIRPAKRQSDEIADKENDDLSNPKKRAKAPVPPERTTSRPKADQVLSPRSANSRTLPRSPVKLASPAKSQLARPVSPLKPQPPMIAGGAAGYLSNMVEKVKTTRAAPTRKPPTSSTASSTAGTVKGRKAPVTAAPARARKGRASDGSESSEASNSTVATKSTVAAKKPVVKKTVMSTLKGIGSGVATKKAPAVKAAGAPRATRSKKF